MAFKNLIGFINNINKSSKNTIAIKKEVEYPHNQYDPEFVAKAKGDSDINWHKVFEEVEDDAQF